MEADWYIDPLGRYEGRFFDGARWTHQVSDRGTLAFDPDWPPVARGRTASGADAAAATASGLRAEPASITTVATSAALGAAATQGIARDHEPTGIEATGSTSARGDANYDAARTVSGVRDDTVETVRTSSVAESPTRQVAVVTNDTRGASSGSITAASTAAGSLTSTTTAPRTSTTTGSLSSAATLKRPAEPIVRDPLASSNSDRRWLYVLGGLLLVAGLALALLPRLFGGDDASDTDVDSDPVEIVDEATNSEPETATDGSADEGPVVEPGGEVAVGAVIIRNGQMMLGDLTTWHGEQAAARGIQLPPDADCWFAKRGDVAEQAAFCGPVGVDAEGRTLYDQLAVAFDDAGPQIVSASVDRGSLIPNIALDEGRELVDRDGDVIVGGPTEQPKRGERVRGN